MDIQAGAEPVGDQAVRIPNRKRFCDKPAIFPIVTPTTQLHLITIPLSDSLIPFGERPLPILRMYRLQPTDTERLLRLKTGILIPPVIERIAPAIGAASP